MPSFLTVTVPAEYGYAAPPLQLSPSSTSSIANLINILSPSYSYVIATAAFSTFIGHWLASRVGTFRRAAKVPYPNCYATDAEAKVDKAKYLFNCAQRAHANFLEHQSTFLASLLISGLSYPVLIPSLVTSFQSNNFADSERWPRCSLVCRQNSICNRLHRLQ